jgi:alkylhydroperoxidase family enzyme
LIPDASSEEMYAHVAEYAECGEYSEREKLAIECAERFALDHLSIDDDFFKRLKVHFSDKEIVDLITCIATFLALGRLTQVFGLSVSTPMRV